MQRKKCFQNHKLGKIYYYYSLCISVIVNHVLLDGKVIWTCEFKLLIYCFLNLIWTFVVPRGWLLITFILEAVTGDQQVWFGHPEDVVDGSGCQDLPHGLGDDVCRLSSPHLHGAQEANDEELVEDRVWTTRGGEKRLPVPLNTYCTCRSWSEEVNQTNICNKQPSSLLIRPKHSDFCKACPFNVLKCKKVSVLPRVVDEGNNIHCKLPAVVTADVFCPHSILWHFHWSKWDQTNEIGFQF